MNLKEMAKTARDENWTDERIELECFRIKEKLLKEILEEMSKLK